MSDIYVILKHAEKNKSCPEKWSHKLRQALGNAKKVPSYTSKLLNYSRHYTGCHLVVLIGFFHTQFKVWWMLRKIKLLYKEIA